MTKGVFITFEGGDGAGKTTLIESVFKELMKGKRPVIKTREPGGTPLGEAVRGLLLHSGSVSPYAELALYLASRAQQVSEVILPALNEGKIVLCDRFNDSTVVYQGFARDLGMEKVTEICRFVSQGLTPDLTLYLDIDPKIGLERTSKDRKHDRLEEAGLSFHQKTREAYHQIQKKEPKRFRIVDASKLPEEVFQSAMQWIEKIS